MAEVQFEKVRETIPKAVIVQARSRTCNQAMLKLERPGALFYGARAGGLIFFLSIGACVGGANIAIATEASAAGWLFLTVGVFALTSALLIFAFIRLFKKSAPLEITPQAIVIDGKTYDPQLFDGFIEDAVNTESAPGQKTRRISNLAWVYGGEVVRIKHGFEGPLASESIAFLNKFVREVHPASRAGIG